MLLLHSDLTELGAWLIVILLSLFITLIISAIVRKKEDSEI